MTVQSPRPDFGSDLIGVISPGNNDCEITQKMALYFDAGPREVWLCSPNGNMRFFTAPAQQPASSTICPQFPKIIKLSRSE